MVFSIYGQYKCQLQSCTCSQYGYRLYFRMQVTANVDVNQCHGRTLQSTCLNVSCSSILTVSTNVSLQFRTCSQYEFQFGSFVLAVSTNVSLQFRTCSQYEFQFGSFVLRLAVSTNVSLVVSYLQSVRMSVWQFRTQTCSQYESQFGSFVLAVIMNFSLVVSYSDLQSV